MADRIISSVPILESSFEGHAGGMMWKRLRTFLEITILSFAGSVASLAADTVWFDDALPAGSVSGGNGGDTWNWIGNNPAPFSGVLAHQSAAASGLHQHYFDWAQNTLSVNAGEVLITHVYLDPSNPPREIMLEWNDGNWDHRAYWGANLIANGTDGTASRHYMGPLPAAGNWTRLQVPASQVGLEGSTIRATAFTLYDGRATWDCTGKSTSLSVVDTNTPPATSTNPPSTTDPDLPKAAIPATNALLPGTTVIDNMALQMPKPGDYGLRVLSPTLLELKRINTKEQNSATVTDWNWVNNFQFSAPAPGAFAVTANGQSVAVQAVGFKRRPLYAPLVGYDLRIENSLYLQLNAPISDGQTIAVKNPDGSLWGANMNFAVTVDPLRYSPAIHVNQEGYMPNHSKKAMIGYYTGSMGEMPVIQSSGFKLVDAKTGNTVHTGSFTQRPDAGYNSPAPYQKVYEADFTGFNTPGQYKLVVPGMGSSAPFNISDGIAINFARTYALGLYHQRCGTGNSMPFTRHTHDTCHHAPVSVPTAAGEYSFVWTTIANYAQKTNPDSPVQIAPRLTGPSAQLFPFVKQGTIDASGGHHDAGDYSKYTINSASFIHYLMFSVDSMAGVAALDNLGIPESGDGISDVLQEAKWEADFLAKLQDTDGGFYFLVYPKNREYEGDVTPDRGDPQIVYPKTTSVTAAAVAALAQCASSPAFKSAYPATAAVYLQKAQLGWQFLTNAIGRYGKNGAYQKITHYGDEFADQDELAWAAAEMFIATGDPAIHQTLLSWFPDPASGSTFRWGWWRLFAAYGNAVRSYGFAAKSGRLPAGQLNSAYLAKCQQVIIAAGDDAALWSQQNAYGSSFPKETKIVQGAGWYFSTDQAYDIAAAWQLNPKPEYMAAILANMNYEGGCNPVNASYVSGLGWKQHRDIVHQYAANDQRIMPPSGIPVGNIQSGFQYLGNYQGVLRALCFPEDKKGADGHAFYDRWGDSWNVENEFVILNSARSLGTLAFVAAQTPVRNQAWKPAAGQINVPSGIAPVGSPVTVSMQASGIDLTGARITWEARDQEPAMGQTFTFSPKNNGTQWVEAEALLPDGRRVFAVAEFKADSADLIWFDDTLPAGAVPGAMGGDAWNWINSPVKSGTKSHQSAVAAGLHQHDFDWASSTLTVGTGTILYAYVYLDPANPPTAIMLQWNDGNWDHRAFWGANSIPWGTTGTASRRNMGPLPAVGQWVQLKVPASHVGLEGRTVKGMGFSTYDGRATWDVAGLLNPAITSGPGTNTNTNPTLPTVSIAGQNGSAAGNNPGKFTFTRTGGTGSSLTVSYSLSGTAMSGVDYIPPAASPAVGAIIGVTSVTIPPGATSATLNITPSTGSAIIDSKTVVATLAGSPTYNVSEPSSAMLTILGNTVARPALAMSASGPTLSWASTPGAVYRIAYKNSLADSTWTYMSNTVNSSGNTTSWTDTDKRSQRFYLILQIQ
jgi:hypothetical protein